MASIKIKHRPSSVKGKEGTLFYQIIHQRHVRQVYPGIHLGDSEWDGQSVVIPRGCGAARKSRLAAIRQRLHCDLLRFHTIIDSLDSAGRPYSADCIVNIFAGSSAGGGFVSFALGLIDEMARIGRLKTAKRFRDTIASFSKYTDNRDISWHDFNSTLISGYEQFLLGRGLCRNSTSFYMRNLRSIANHAIEHDYTMPRNPFSHVYTGIDKTVKRAIPLRTLCRIRDADLSAWPSLEFARNAFMFSFYTRGMSFVDMAFLRKTDVSNGIIVYRRRKTRQLIRVKIEAQTRRIIQAMGESPSSRLLPIIGSDTDDPERQYLNAYHRVNRNLKKLGKMLGMETKLTMYVARHTWASIARSSNIPIAIISEAMGHDSESTTRIYLSTLDTSSVDRANSKILKLMV